MSGNPGDTDEFALAVDHLFPDLDAYEAALYVFLYRRTVHVGQPTIRIGKKSISSQFVKASRGGGAGNRGGASGVNYRHLSEALKALESKGCLRSGDTTREGTLYTLDSPSDVPSVRRRLSAVAGESPASDYFTDPVRRLELFERDHWICRFCGELVSPDNATLDHFVPQSKGGANSPENLRTACLSCNSIKSGRTYEEVAASLLEAVARRRASAVQSGSLPK